MSGATRSSCWTAIETCTDADPPGRVGGPDPAGIAPIISPGGVRDVRDIMDSVWPACAPTRPWRRSWALLREQGLPGVPVVDDWGGAASGSSPRPTWFVPDEEGDLHLPHYIKLFGEHGLRRAAGPLRAAPAQGVRLQRGRGTNDWGPRHGRPGYEREGRRLSFIHESGHNRLPGGRRRASGRRRHAPGCARRPCEMRVPAGAARRVVISRRHGKDEPLCREAARPEDFAPETDMRKNLREAG